APSLSGALDQSSVKFQTTSAPALTIQGDSPPWKLTGNVASLRNAMTPHIEYIMAAWSPTGCSRLKGCMLACVTSKHSVFVYIPSSSHVDKQWKKYVVLDKHIAHHWRAKETVDLAMADNVESSSISWSPKISLNNIGSLLALGNKAGSITIWHVTDPSDVRCVKSWKSSSDSWIVRLSWSPWMIEGDRYVSILAYASADGVVCAHKVKFNCESPLETIEVSDNIMETSIQTLHPCTIMRWSPIITESATQTNLLAFSRGNRLNVWLPESGKIILWRKPIAKAIADITWDTYGKRLFVFFMDGKHSVLRLHEEELIVDEESVEFIHQEIISRCHVQARTNIIQEEGETENTNADDEGGDEETGGGMGQTIQTLFDQLDAFIRLPKGALTRNPTYHLWDVALLLGESAKANENDTEVLDHVLSILNTNVFQPREDVQALSKRETLPDTSTTLESRLQAMIFSDPSIAADRVSVYLWDQLRNCLKSGMIKNKLEQRAADGEVRIRKHCTRTILKQFEEESSKTPVPQSDSELDVQMKECDQTLLLLLCDSILLFHHDDKELVDQAERIYGILQDQLQDLCDIKEQMSLLQDIRTGTAPVNKSFSFGRETCPACSSEIKLENITHGTCANDHFWQRCSVSLMVISDFHPRMCLGCRRKTLMVPDSEPRAAVPHLGMQVRSWLNIALQANSVCCFCGERYYTALRHRGA
ncbi:hypothetical protein BGX27_001761, partial [Mortierella sp. AM989]